MRGYGLITPQRWIGATGKKLRRELQQRQPGDPEREAYKDAQIVADMLLTNPHAGMEGLYYISLYAMGEFTGLRDTEIARALAILEHEEFAFYDEGSEFVWVREMARFQMYLPLKKGDRRITAVQAWYRGLPRNPFLGRFYDRYATDLWLVERRDPWRPDRVISAADERKEQLPAAVNGTFGIYFNIFLETFPAAVSR